jgi:hypothetical protein
MTLSTNDAELDPPMFVQTTAVLVCLSAMLALQVPSGGLLFLGQMRPIASPTSIRLGLV